MKKRKSVFLLSIFFLLLLPSLSFAHGDDFHIEIVHIMDNGFHGKHEGKIVEVVLAPDVEIDKHGKNIKFGNLSVGNIVLVKGSKMSENKIGASKISVDKTNEHQSHKMNDHKEMMEEHSNHEHGDH